MSLKRKNARLEKTQKIYEKTPQKTSQKTPQTQTLQMPQN